jgi:hypothetical protein
MNQLNQQDIYVMRLWHERSSNQQDPNNAWRISISDTKSQQKHHFANLESLLAFFKERLEDN